VLARCLLAMVLLCVLPARGEGRIEMFYLGTPDCPYCRQWEARARGELLASAEGQAVRYVEIRGETLRQPIVARHYPPEFQWVYEQIGPSRGVPRFLLAVDGRIAPQRVDDLFHTYAELAAGAVRPIRSPRPPKNTNAATRINAMPNTTNAP